MYLVLKQQLRSQSKIILLWPPQHIIRIFGTFLAGLSFVGVFQLARRKWGQVLLMPLRKFKPLQIVFLSLLVITAVEIILQQTLPGKARYHEVDGLLYQMDRQVYNANYVLMGDSVARQLFGQDDRMARQGWAVLATNQAITMSGQYFILRRYLDRNPVPKIVVMVSLPYLSGSLDTPFADNYIRRTFTEWREIGEVFLLNRDPVFTLKSVAYKLFPSFKYRLYLQKKLLGFTNADIYTGGAYGKKPQSSDSYSMVRFFIKKIVSERDISSMYFEKILQITQRNNISFQFILPPIKEGNIYAIRGYEKLFLKRFPPLEKRYSNFQYVRELTHYPEDFFVDNVHYSSTGLSLARKYMDGQMDTVLRNMRH